MSNPLAIAAVTATLGRLIRNVTLTGVAFTMQPPDAARGTETARQLNLFLYRVGPNPAYRNADLPTRGGNGELVGQPVLALDLHYLLTAYGQNDDDLDGHHLLAQAMSLVHDRPVLTRASIAAAMSAESTSPATHKELAGADLADQVEHVKLTLEPFTTEDLFKLWSAFQTGYRLSVGYEASLVLIERRAPRRLQPPPHEARVTAMPLNRPRLERIEPPQAASGQTIELIGSGLGAGEVHVRIDGELRPPDTVESERVTVTLPGTLSAGVHAVAVAQAVDVEGRDVPLFESNVASLVVIPEVTVAGGPVAAGGELTLGVTPPVTRGQDAAIVVGATSIPVPPRTADTPVSSLTVTLPPAVTPGERLVRVRVEGAESALTVSGGAYSGPKVTVT